MTEPLATRIHARVTMTLEGSFAGASAGAVRAVLSRAVRSSPDAAGVHLVTVDEVEIVGRAEDAWIAATARLHGIPLVTNNAADYAGVDTLAIISVPSPER